MFSPIKKISHEMSCETCKLLLDTQQKVDSLPKSDLTASQF